MVPAGDSSSCLVEVGAEESMSDKDYNYLKEREELAIDRTDLSEHRTRLARDNNELAKNRTRLAQSRTRLANKRTFLAWCRTSLSFMTFGFLLEKVDAFLVSEHHDVSQVLLSELGTLGKLAFLGGPVLMLFAGWRYWVLEREIGREKESLFILPEMVLFGVIVCAALLYAFF